MILIYCGVKDWGVSVISGVQQCLICIFCLCVIWYLGCRSNLLVKCV